jgi:hypothetical protein
LYLAGKVFQSLRPLLIIRRFFSPEVDTQRAKARRARRLRRAAEHIALPRDLEIDKTGGYDRSL